MLIVRKINAEIREVAARNADHVKLRVEESLGKSLGICVAYKQELRYLKISNYPLIDASLRRLGFIDANTVHIPVASGVRIERDEIGEQFDVPYSELVGVLLYLARSVRPYISIDVGNFSRCCSDP